MVIARDQLTGRTLGDFVVRDKLGEGGFGAVYRAEQPLLGREAVIKVLHRNLRASDVLIQRFLREARLASQLDHPYAAHVYAFGAEDDGLLWIAMELVRGTPLDKLLRTQKTLPLDRLVALVDRICEVVHTAHEQGIVHRDLKPGNVIVMSRAGRILPKLLDFGIAKVADQDVTRLTPDPDADAAPRVSSGNIDLAYDHTRDAATPVGDDTLRNADTPPDVLSNLTQRGSLVGSPRYMAPEQWVDPAAADARADIYALGVLAYEALTGKVPFDGKTLYEVAAAHAEGDVPPVGDKLPAALDGVFQRALAKTPEERYASALDFAKAFREASGLGEETREPLPQLEDSLREALIHDAPQPIAEAVAALAAATNAHQARDAVRIVAHVAVRFIGLAALACRTRIGAAGAHDSQAVVEALRALRRRELVDEEWLDLARELCRPYASNPDAFPIPELVTMFFGAQIRERAATESMSMPMQSHRSGQSEDQARELLAQSLPVLTRLLRSIAFLADYPLVVWRADRAERWMGIRRPKRSALAIRGSRLEPGKPALVDRDGRPILSLWPLAQVCEPSPGAPDELFLFEGKGRHGARLVAMPLDFERQDDELWHWFGDALIDTLDEPGASTDAPYRGLSAFTPNDAALFFGREREIDSVINRLRVQALLAVVGPSGAGKSSFVQAGIVPSLPADWRTITVRPGPSPLAALQARLAQDGIAVEQLRAYTHDTNTTLVLVIDQFEELFTLCQNPVERAQYAEVLATAARSAEDRVRVIITLRDDFLLAAEQLAPLRARLGQGVQLLATPAREDLLRIVTEPARRAGYDFEDRELAAQMVDAVADHPGALALLSFAAAKLWDLRDRHFKQLGRRAYEAMGGVAGALARHAEETLASLSPDEQRLVREAFRHLVTAEGTRAVLTRRELVQLLGGGTRADTVVERLVAARLLVASEGERGEERIEVIHEALLTAWPRLVGWRREDAEGARLRDQLRAAARQWQERDRPRGLLWRDDALTEYQLWRARHPGALTDVEAAFADASIGDARRARRLRRLLLVLAFVALTVGLGVLYRTNQETQRQRERAVASQRTAHSRLVDLYEEQGRLATLANEPMRALVYLELAFREGANDPALHFQLNWTTQLMEGQLAWMREPAAIRSNALSRDGTIVAAGLKTGAIGIWNVATQQRLHTINAHGKSVGSVEFSDDGRVLTSMASDGVKEWEVKTGSLIRHFDHAGEISTMARNEEIVVSAGTDGTVKVWDATSGSLRFELPKHAARVRVTAIASRGDRIATGDDTGKVYIWDAVDGRALASFVAHRGLILEMVFGPDDELLGTTGFEDGLARVWRSDGKLALEVKHRAPQVRTIAFSADKKRIVTGAEDRTLRVTSLAGGTELAVLESDAHPLAAVFDPTDHRIAATYRDGTVQLWDAATGAPLWKYLGHSEAAFGTIAYDKSGTRFTTASSDGTIGIWDANHRGHVVLRGHTGTVWSSAFSDDGALVATAEHGNTRIWKTTGELVTTIRAAMPDFGALAFSPDGKAIALVGANAEVFDVATGRKLFTLDGEKKVTHVDYDRAGERIVTTTERGTVALWNAKTGTLLRRFPAHEGAIWYVAFSPDGQTIATGGADGYSRIWLAESGKLQRTLDDKRKYIGSVSYNRAGTRIVTSGDDGFARIWDLGTGKIVAEFAGNQSTVSTAELSPDENFLLTSGHDGTVRIWDVGTTRQLATIGALTTGYYSAHFDPKGEAVIVTSEKAASIWRMPTRAWTRAELQNLVACKVPAPLHARNAQYPSCDESKLR